MELLLGKTMKIFISGTYPSSKDPGGKFWFQLQIFKFWVWLDSVKALEPLFDLQEAQGKTSNMASKPTFRRGNLEKSSALRWSDAPNLGAPKFFWEVFYIYILIFKRVFEVTTFCWTNFMRFLTKKSSFRCRYLEGSKWPVLQNWSLTYIIMKIPEKKFTTLSIGILWAGTLLLFIPHGCCSENSR